MVRVCVIGNSHVASLKHGWDEISNTCNDFDLTFFASPGNGLMGLRLQDGCLLSDNDVLSRNMSYTSGGLDRIDMAAYDVFLVYGLGLSVPALGSHLSLAVMEQTCRDVIFRSLSLSVGNLIRRATNKPIYIGHKPQLARRSEKPIKLHSSGVMDYKSVLCMMNKELGIENSELVGQPEETLVDNLFTRGEFSIGSTRLDVGDGVSNQPHPATDNVHMNGNFGHVWLDNFFAILRSKRRNIESSRRLRLLTPSRWLRSEEGS